MDAKVTKRSVKSWATNFYKGFSKNMLLYTNCRRSKIRLLHMYVIHRMVYFERYCILKSYMIIIWFGRPKIYPARNKTNICHGRSLFINFCFYSLHRDPFERNTQPQNHSTFLHMLLFDLVFQSSKSWFLLDCCADSWYQMKLCFYWDLNNFLLL